MLSTRYHIRLFAALRVQLQMTFFGGLFLSEKLVFKKKIYVRLCS